MPGISVKIGIGVYRNRLSSLWTAQYYILKSGSNWYKREINRCSIKQYNNDNMKKLLISLTFLILTLAVQATTYYVRTDGSDSHAGTSNTSGGAWLTLTHAYANTTSGDIIRLVAGSYTVSAQLVVPVGVSTEGDGVTTVLNSLVSAAYTPTFLLSSSSQGTNGNQHISNLTISGGSGLNSYTAYEPIVIDRRSNVSIYNCTFQYFSYRGPRFQGTSTDGQPTTYSTGNSFHDNIVLDCCNFVGLGSPSGSGQGCLEIGGQSGMFVYNNTITVSYRTGGLNGYDIKYCMNGYNKGLKIYNNTLARPPYSGASLDFDFSIELWNNRGGIEIYNNIISGSIDLSGDASGYVGNDEGGYGYECKVYGNTIGWDTWQGAEQLGIDIERAHTGGLYIYNNHFKHLSQAVNFLQGYDTRMHDIVENVYIYYNIFDCTGNSTAHNGANTIKVSFEGDITTSYGIIYRYIYIQNNTFYQGTGGQGTEGAIALTIGGTGSYFYIQNNIINGYGAAASAGAIWVDGAYLTSLTHLTLQNNLYYTNYVNGVVLYNGASPSYDVNSDRTPANPLFVSTSDFHLQSGSPAINSGVHITTPALTTDYAGTALGNPPEIGAYEYGSGGGGITIPSITTALATSITNNGATFGGNVTSNGGDINAYAGVVYATWSSPTTSSNTGSTYSYYLSQQTNPFSISVSGLLNPLTLYYYRAYIVNSAGTAYGTQNTITTLGYPQVIYQKHLGKFVKYNGKFNTYN